MKQTFLALDQFINTLLPAPFEGFGFADETISARAWRLRKSDHWFCKNAHKWIDRIFFWHYNHCDES